MKKFIFPLLGLLLAPAPARAAAPCGGLEKAAAQLSERVAERPRGLEQLFDKSLFAHISAEKLGAYLAGQYKANGPVVSTVLVSSDNACSGHFLLETGRGYRLPAAISLNPVTGRISGLFFGTAYKKDLTLDAAVRQLKALPGKTGLLAMRLGEKPEAVAALNESEQFAAASAFKLYVLGALLENKVPWDKVLRLRSEDRSLPTGRLQDWPEGSPFTVHTLAALMISESDNTAADTLISALGRRNIEAALPALGHSNPSLLRPFLRTSELFRLKADSEKALKYMNLPAEEKYNFLEGLGQAPLSAAALRLSPFGIERLEWLISPADLCRVMKYIADKDDKAALDILAMNPGLRLPPGAFLYAGYKGGGGPGVLSMTWLLKDLNSHWYCLSAVWNDEREKLDEAKFYAVMNGALAGLGSRGE